MDRLFWMHCFSRVAETGSFSAVARELETTQPTISKHIAALEDYLGVRLLHRSTRRLSLTPEGERYYQECRPLLLQLDEAEGHIRSGQLKGARLRIGCPSALAQHRVLPLVAEFLQRHPDISIDLLDDGEDLLKAGLDLAFRLGDLPDSAYKARRVGVYALSCVATRRYLESHGTPQHPQALEQHNCISYVPHGGEVRHWLFQGYPIKPMGNLRVDSLEGLRFAALSHLGIVVAPTWLFPHTLFDEDELISLLTDWPIQAVPVTVLYPSKHLLPQRSKYFMDFIAERFLQDPCLNGEAVEELGLGPCMASLRGAA